MQNKFLKFLEIDPSTEQPRDVVLSDYSFRSFFHCHISSQSIFKSFNRIKNSSTTSTTLDRLFVGCLSENLYILSTLTSPFTSEGFTLCCLHHAFPVRFRDDKQHSTRRAHRKENCIVEKIMNKQKAKNGERNENVCS